MGGQMIFNSSATLFYAFFTRKLLKKTNLNSEDIVYTDTIAKFFHREECDKIYAIFFVLLEYHMLGYKYV
jgi:hypothetical protein